MIGNEAVQKALAEFVGVLSHPYRIRILESLRDGERDVTSLHQILGASHSCTSQHLGILRTNRIVMERRVGRHVYYKLAEPELVEWLAQGSAFLRRQAQGFSWGVGGAGHSNGESEAIPATAGATSGA
jgi:DNA-binding transcriptional ArsR family regulator